MHATTCKHGQIAGTKQEKTQKTATEIHKEGAEAKTGASWPAY